MKRRKRLVRAAVVAILALSLGAVSIILPDAHRGRTYVSLSPSARGPKAIAEPAVQSSIYLGKDIPLLSPSPRLQLEPVETLEDRPALSRIGPDALGETGEMLATSGRFAGGVGNTGYSQLDWGSGGGPSANAIIPEIARSYPVHGAAFGGTGGGGGAGPSSDRDSSPLASLASNIQVVGPSRTAWGPAMHPKYHSLGNFPIPEPAATSLCAISMLLLLTRGRRLRSSPLARRSR